MSFLIFFSVYARCSELSDDSYILLLDIIPSRSRDTRYLFYLFIAHMYVVSPLLFPQGISRIHELQNSFSLNNNFDQIHGIFPHPSPFVYNKVDGTTGPNFKYSILYMNRFFFQSLIINLKWWHYYVDFCESNSCIRLWFLSLYSCVHVYIYIWRI